MNEEEVISRIIFDLKWLKHLREKKSPAIEGVKLIDNGTLIALTQKRLEEYNKEYPELFVLAQEKANLL